MLPEGAVVVAAPRAGLDCAEVCAAHTGSGAATPLVCDAALLPVVNDCATLRTHFRCDRCHDSMGGDQPAYVAASAPVDKEPGACLVNTDASLFSCAGKWQHAQRLCPCMPAPRGA